MKRSPHASNFATITVSERKCRLSSYVSRTLCVLLLCRFGNAQQSPQQETPQQEVRRLTLAVDQAQAQVDASQRQLIELKNSLAALEQRLAKSDQTNAASASQPAAIPATPPPSRDEELRERLALQESQLATLDQSKVESESKYPVKLSGMILLNGFVNTSAVDRPASPTVAVSGDGSTGASLRQTVLGIDARGPTLAGATSHADLRVDFFGSSAQNTYNDVGGLLRLRTAHAILDWGHTQAFVELDRPIISPNAPTSLVAVAQPALAWSGNLWAWAPQVGVSHALDLNTSTRLTLQAALIDAPDPPALTPTPTITVSQAESSRWPGTELHLALSGKHAGVGPSVGIGGYFSPHRTPGGFEYDSWATTLDLRLPLPLGLELSGSFYRGAALGGLGGGAYKDYLYEGDFPTPYTQALDDVGGWAQLKKHVGSRLEFNGALGLDNAFASELLQYAYTSPTAYQNLARNRTFFANTIYSPSQYLLFSLEYRNITTTPVTGRSANTNVIGVAAGYRF